MKNYIFLLSIFFFVSCSETETKSKEGEMVDHLTSGKWTVVDFDGEINNFELGVVFSKDKQFFNMDSQGRIIPTQHEQIFSLNSDTLQIIDFKYEPRFIDKKGTLVFKVKELDESNMTLKSIYPDSTSTYKLKNEDL